MILIPIINSKVSVRIQVRKYYKTQYYKTVAITELTITWINSVVNNSYEFNIKLRGNERNSYWYLPYLKFNILQVYSLTLKTL